jgi:uncharacterized protein YgiM (DUF1202 family)
VRSFYFIPPVADPAKDALVAEAKPGPESMKAVAEVPQNKPAALAPITGLVAEAKTKDESAASPVFVTLTRSLFAKPGSRLRAEPSKDASVVAKLPANAEIRAVARSKDGAWYEVATRQGKTAYIHADAVTDFRAADKPKKSVPPAKTLAFNPPQPAAPAPQVRSQTGIGMVDKALNWLQSNAGASQQAQDPVRASR